jgi:modulator of FtsH protease
MNSSMDVTGIAYNTAEWGLFFSAETAASAALTGLLFVSISINLRQIVESPALAARSGKALATLTAVLLISTLCLVPGQGARVLGAEIAIAALLVWVMATILQHRAARKNPYVSRGTRDFHMVLTQGSALPMIVGAVSLIVGRGGGLYWLMTGTLVSFLSALLDAWVLLIEIQR